MPDLLEKNGVGEHPHLVSFSRREQDSFLGKSCLTIRSRGLPSCQCPKTGALAKTAFWRKGSFPLLPFMRDGGGCLCCPKFTDEEGGPQVLAFLLSQESLNKNPAPAASKWRPRKEIRPFLLERLLEERVHFYKFGENSLSGPSMALLALL